MAAEVALANVIISVLFFSLGTRIILVTCWFGIWEGNANALRWIPTVYSSWAVRSLFRMEEATRCVLEIYPTPVRQLLL